MRQVGQLPRIIAWCTVNKTLKKFTTVVFQTSYAYRNILLTPNFTIRTGQCCTMLLILTAFPQNDNAWSKNITFHSPSPLSSDKIKLCDSLQNIFHILKVTFSKTSQSTTSHKLHTIQVEFEVPKATKMTIFQEVALCSLNHSNNNTPNYNTLRHRRWKS